MADEAPQPQENKTEKPRKTPPRATKSKTDEPEKSSRKSNWASGIAVVISCLSFLVSFLNYRHTLDKDAAEKVANIKKEQQQMADRNSEQMEQEKAANRLGINLAYAYFHSHYGDPKMVKETRMVSMGDIQTLKLNPNSYETVVNTGKLETARYAVAAQLPHNQRLRDVFWLSFNLKTWMIASFLQPMSSDDHSSDYAKRYLWDAKQDYAESRDDFIETYKSFVGTTLNLKPEWVDVNPFDLTLVEDELLLTIYHKPHKPLVI